MTPAHDDRSAGPREGVRVTAGMVSGRHLTRSARRPGRWRRVPDVRAGQLVTTQIAVVLLLTGAVHSSFALAAAAFLSVVLLASAWLRLQGRWAYEWLWTAVSFTGRPHVGGTGPELLAFVAPGARLRPAELAGDPAAVIVDGWGITAVLELGDPAGLLAEGLHLLPSPVALLPAADSEHPPCRVQLLLTGVPAPAARAGNGVLASSYRQLTEGRLLGHSRAVLAVRVLAAEGWSADDLMRSLSGLVRRTQRRLGTVPARPLGEAAVLRVLADLAHADGAGPVRESWSGLLIGGLTQVAVRLRHWPDPGREPSRHLVGRILSLPCAATTVAVTAGPHRPGSHAVDVRRPAEASPDLAPADVPVELTVRLAAPDGVTLGNAVAGLRRLLGAERADARRLDGAHLDGLIATLPLGGGGGRPAEAPGRSAGGAAPPEVAEGPELTVGTAGLMVGRNRHGDPVVARLFRPEPTRAVLIGGVRCAQLLVVRALALGARVVVQTARPQAWDPLVRGAANPGEAIAVVPPGRAVQIPASSPLHPLLMVVDVGPVGADTRVHAGWQATLVVRDEAGPADVDVASRADLLVVQPLRREEADLVGAAVGLGETAQWLTRIRPDMVGLVNRRAVRWAALAQTRIEAQLIGPPVRGG